jgi:adenylate cyclase
MATEDFKRKLTAIFSADVAGYSRLMGEDEAATVKTLANYREVMATLIKQHRGRVVDSPGDNVLAEFVSVVDAVQCAVAVQKELQTRNTDLPESRRMEFRIGINLGDVIDEEDRIYGDGVNIAARLEALAEPSGICISKTAFDQIETKLPLGYEFLGEQDVKNIAKPVGAYRVLMDAEAAGKVIGEIRPKAKQLRWAAIGGVVVLIMVAVALAIWNFYFRPAFEPASVERMAFPLPDKPSIAVLPFANMSEDPKQEFLADGITENIISALSQVPKLFVIARNSTYTYKGKPVKVQEVAEELGVRYVLEGSVQRSGDTLRITAQFIDALSGHHLWSERYDRELRNIFALQDEITMKIIEALEVKLTEGEQARFFAKGTKNLQAYLKFLEAVDIFFTMSKEGNAQARILLQEVIDLDPEFAAAYDALGSVHFMDTRLGLSKSPKKSLKQAFELTKKAIDLDDSYAFAHMHLGFLDILMKREYDKAIASGERAIELAPNSASAHNWMGVFLTFAGRHEEAVRYSEQALRLDPIPQGWYIRNLGLAYFGAGRYEEAISAYKKSLQRAPNDFLTHVNLTTAYSWAGRLEEARAQADEVLKINPKSSVGGLAKKSLYKNQADRDRYLDGLRKAGLPETPPLLLPDKPSIAVLLFVNMSGDPEQEYFVDGMTDDLITDLSKISGLFVIARNSVFRYKGKPVDVKKVSRELGVKHVLEGSVRKAGNQVRINAQLIDATTAGHLWAERYDGKMDDVFALQDEITGKIVTALAVKLTGGEQKQFSKKETENIAAYDAFLKGWARYQRRTRKDWVKAVSYFKKAIEFDPDYSRAYAALASIYYWSYRYWWFSSLGIKDYTEAYKLTSHYTQMAMKNPTSRAYWNASQMSLRYHQHEQAIAEVERAIALDPNDPDMFIQMARVLIFAGRPEEAVGFIKNAMRLDPHYPAEYQFIHGLAYFAMGQLEEAVTLLESAVRRNPDVPLWGVPLAVTYTHLGRDQEAHAMYGRIGYHYFSPGYARWWWPFKDQEVADRFTDGLRKARRE